MPMPKNDWKVILEAWDFLKANLTITKTLLDDLIAERVLDPEDQQRISLEPKYGQVDKLLNIIKHKPSECKALVKLKSILQADSKFIADELERIEEKFPPDTISPSQEQSHVDTSPHKLKDRIRQVLVESFDNINGESCPLAEVAEVVSRTVKAEGFHYTWNGDQLRHFVVDDVFVDVQFVKKTKRKPASFMNLAQKKKEITQPEGANAESSVSRAPQEILEQKSTITSMSPSELVQFLRPKLSEIGINEATMQKMITEEIDGNSFLFLEEHHLKNYFSEMTLGKRIKFMQVKRDVFKEPFEMQAENVQSTDQTSDNFAASQKEENQFYSDRFHKFGSEVSSVDIYVKGRLLEVEGHTRGNLMIPRRHFICPTEEGTELCRKIARETVIFASACMNERTNGTLHAGVCPPSTSEGKPGEILGLRIDRAECDEVVKNFIKESFYEDQLDIAERAISNVKFIPVVNQMETGGETNLFVIEIEVVPSAKLVGNDAFFVKTQLLGNRRKKRKQDLYRMVAGKPEPQTEENVISFMESKQKLTDLRAELESKEHRTKYNVDLRKQILNLFTGGSDTIEDDIYPVLFISPLDQQMDQVFIRENLTFIQHFDSRVIFDFDSTGSEKGLYKFFDEEEDQCYTVYTTDNFQKRDSKLNKEVSTAHKAWVFSNGYSTMQKDGLQPFAWKQERSSGFKEGLRFYHQDIPDERGIAVIFLFSKNYEVMLEAAEEVLLRFKEQWMVIAENEDIADLWKRELLRRNVVMKDSLQERCVVGMPWCDVNQTFIDVLQPLKVAVCHVPLSNGASHEMTEKDRNGMCDLEILSSNECENNDEVHEKEKIEILRRKVEEKFFRGGTVEWWNFWFGEDHVKKRQLHNNLLRDVESALSTQKADEIVRVTLLHQPGAGGTTSSRQVLWDLRQRYKCCVVKRISDDTAEQIATLRRFGESSNQRPPLILVDNDDEEHVDNLLAELEDMAQASARKNEESNNVFCVLLHCKRRANLPHSHEGRQLHLRHDFSAQELAWFGKKYDELKKKNEEQKGIDPKLLISFNLLKNNFSTDYVKRTVKMLMKDITADKELRLLRYLSFLNTYDLDSHSVPVACFDAIMEMRTKKTVLMQTGLYKLGSIRQKCWETKLCSSVRVLLNETSNRKEYGASIKSIKIITSVLSREILATFLTQHKLSDIILEMLESEIFDFENSSTAYLLGVLSTIVKKRATTQSGHLKKFAPLILEIKSKEGEDKAAEVLTQVFKVTNIAMVAQQLARLYIHYRNWPEAEKYASKATDLVQTNPFLWDTHAQVYERQLRAKTDNCIITKDVISDTLTLVLKAIGMYRREQKAGQTATNKPFNYSGYIGEVRVTIKLFEVLWKYQDSFEETDRHAFLVDPDVVPETFFFLEDDDIRFIKASGRTASGVIEKIEDELLQLKSDRKYDSPNYLCLDDLMELKNQLFQFYGENTDDVPETLSLEKQCEFRRRRVRQIGATSLQGLLQLRFKNKDETNLIRVYNLMMQNVNTSMCNSFDLCTVLNTIVAMFLHEDKFVKKIPFPKILQMSQRLVEAKNKDLLESYLYVLLFNVPTPSRLDRGYELCQSSTIRETIKVWREAFYDKHPRQREEQRRFRKKDTTMFFLGHGNGMDEIVHHKQLAIRDEDLRVSDDFWHTPIAREKFLRYEGTLLMNGMEVRAVLESQKGNKYDICIPTSMPVKRTMWQKKVFFVLGFSWSGPKAYDVTLDDPSKPDPKEPAIQNPNPPMTRSDGLTSMGSPRGTIYGRGGSSPREATHGRGGSSPRGATYGRGGSSPREATHGRGGSSPRGATYGRGGSSPRGTTYGRGGSSPRGATYGRGGSSPRGTTYGRGGSSPRGATYGRGGSSPRGATYGRGGSSPRGATYGRGGSSPREYGWQPPNDVPRKPELSPRTNLRE